MRSRVLLKIAAIVLAAGCVLMLAGWAAGANGRVVWYNGLRVTSGDEKIEASTGLFSWVRNLRVETVSGEPETLTVRDLTGVTALDVSSVDADIEFIAADDFGFDILTYSGTPEWSLTNGVLTVREVRQGVSIMSFEFNTNEPAYIKVYYRADQAYDRITTGSVSGDVFFPGAENEIPEFKVSTTSGNIFAANFESRVMKYGTVSGSVALSGIKTQSISVSTTSGDIVFSGETDKCDVNTVSGEVSISSSGEFGISTTSGNVLLCGTIRGASVNTVSGAVEILTTEHEDAYSYNLNTVSGDMSVNGAHIDGRSSKRTNGAYSLRIGTTSGDVTLEFEEQRDIERDVEDILREVMRDREFSYSVNFD